MKKALQNQGDITQPKIPYPCIPFSASQGKTCAETGGWPYFLTLIAPYKFALMHPVPDGNPTGQLPVMGNKNEGKCQFGLQFPD